MAATVKPIEAKAVHLIQSGQVIVDLCSVVKELVENSLDAGADAIEIRFKNHGLDEIEVQDNGSGIAAANYESVALKHYTSKLATYDDLESLSTFGFRGEALSSLCALSIFSITTAQASEAPRGHRLSFESSGKLKATSLVACQRGTTVSVGSLFENLPVRRKELAKNVKREYAKVLGILHAYACISTNVKITVKNSMPKGKSMTVFATNSNSTTRENIANVYGAKTLSALASLDLKLNVEPASQLVQTKDVSSIVIVQGHISKPSFGEGRQTPDRQMFFVNGRPCGLPQIAKAMNEVYKSYNVSQSPFIFADFKMDTKAYDVNVSPDKRSIFLHNAALLIESLKAELISMFDNHDQTMPQSQLQTPRLPKFMSTTDRYKVSNDSQSELHDSARNVNDPEHEDESDHDALALVDVGESGRLLHTHFHDSTSTRATTTRSLDSELRSNDGMDSRAFRSKNAQATARVTRVDDNYDSEESSNGRNGRVASTDVPSRHASNLEDSKNKLSIESGDERESVTGLDGVDSRAVEQTDGVDEPQVVGVGQLSRQVDEGPVPTAFDRMRPRRSQPEMATITIGDKTITKMIGSPNKSTTRSVAHEGAHSTTRKTKIAASQGFSNQLSKFAALGTQDQIELERIEVSDEDEASLIGSDARDGDSDPNQVQSETESVDHSRQPVDDVRNRPGKEVTSDSEYIDEDEERNQEKARVASLIRAAEEATTKNDAAESIGTIKPSRGTKLKEATTKLEVVVECSIPDIRRQSLILAQQNLDSSAVHNQDSVKHLLLDENAEETLSLTVSKSDFADMRIVGQFNLGFILAVRKSNQHGPHGAPRDRRDELFIIDQHASDEKYNFERLQTETVVGNQRMVRPVTLDLTVVEEEILIDAGAVLEKNGFVVDIDVSGDKPVGQRCQLLSLPLSREVVFDTRDLDELIHLLSETPLLSDLKSAPRPSKVRKMFAMRACRSSIMIGKTLSRAQMRSVVQHMGMIDKPWNCPHGRPTMRHLASLDSLEASLWREGDGLVSRHDIGTTAMAVATRSGAAEANQVWQAYAR